MTSSVRTPIIDDFIDCLENYNFLEIFKNHEIYLWSNFPYNFTWDVDLVFIGNPTEELGKKILDFKTYAKNTYDISIDEQVFENTKVFKHIEDYNRTGDHCFDGTLLQYKLKENFRRNPEPVKINKYFWKFVLKETGDKMKYRYGKTNIHYPIEIKDFIQLVFNIKNQHIYNTLECKTFKKYRKLDQEFREMKWQTT